MRPLILADPILRADKPEMVEESNLTGVCAKVVIAHNDKSAHAKDRTRTVLLTQEAAIISLKSSYSKIVEPNRAGDIYLYRYFLAAGILNCASSIGTLTSIFSTEITACWPGSFFAPTSIRLKSTFLSTMRSSR